MGTYLSIRIDDNGDNTYNVWVNDRMVGIVVKSANPKLAGQHGGPYAVRLDVPKTGIRWLDATYPDVETAADALVAAYRNR